MGLAERLHEKGWTKAEIEHAEAHMAPAKQNRTPKHRIMEEGIWWLSLAILALANMAISWFLFPFLAALPKSLGMPIAGILGLLFGVLFAHLGHQIARLEAAKHSFVLFVMTLTVAFVALVVGMFSVVIAIVFSGVFVAYYSYEWWRNV